MARPIGQGGVGFNSESIIIPPGEELPDEFFVQAARAALCVASDAAEGRMFLDELGIDPHWLRKYVDTYGWPK